MEFLFIQLACESLGAQKAAKIGLGGAIVQRVNAEVANAHALLLDVNVTQMFVEIVGLGNKVHLHNAFTLLLLGTYCLVEALFMSSLLLDL